MIRGINRNIGVEQSNDLIRRVFEERFGPRSVISVQTIRKNDNVQHIYRKRQNYKSKVEHYRE